jgi:hypothetical protein
MTSWTRVNGYERDGGEERFRLLLAIFQLLFQKIRCGGHQLADQLTALDIQRLDVVGYGFKVDLFVRDHLL